MLDICAEWPTGRIDIENRTCLVNLKGVRYRKMRKKGEKKPWKIIKSIHSRESDAARRGVFQQRFAP